MPKQKSIEIKNLFYNDLKGMFNQTLNEVAKGKSISRKQFDKVIIGAKSNELRELFEDKVATNYLDNNKFDLSNFIYGHLKNQKVIVDSNASSFTAYLIYVNASVNVYNRITKAIEGKRVNPTLRVNFSLYGLVVRRVMEITDVLICGYIDASMILWRSMYENAVTLLFLALQDNTELSGRYFDHSMRHFDRKMKSYLENHKDLGFKAIDKKQQSAIERRKKKLTAKYGDSFLKGDYSWAETVVKGRATFRSIEELSGIKRFRPYYNLCSEQTHASFNGLSNYFEGGKLILPRLMQQEIDLKSFVDPMQFTIAVLHEVNDYIIWQFSPKSEQSANLLLLKKTFEKLQSSFDQPGI
jgi:hypothetical protein